MTLVSIVTENDPLANDLLAFGDALVTSNWWQSVGAEYGTSRATASLHYRGPAIPATPTGATADMGMTGAKIEQYIEGLIAANAPLGPGEQPIYLLYLPDGVLLSRNGGLNTSCDSVGYHAVAPTVRGHYVWAVIQRCTDAESALRLTTTVASHEVEEASTDPYPGSGWTLGLIPPSRPWAEDIWRSFAEFGHVELADLCEGTRIEEGGFTYQRSFSNVAAAMGGDPCIPPVDTPYFNVGTTQGFFQATPGTIVSIPLTGWSTGPIDDWELTHIRRESCSTGTSAMPCFREMIRSSTTAALGLHTYATVNNARTATLEVTVDGAAPSGSFAIFQIWSAHRQWDGRLPGTGEHAHGFPVGVYVP